MLIYIIHSNKIYDYRLPTNVFGKYILTDYDNFGLKRNLVNIEAVDNEWHIFENNSIKIDYNNREYESIPLYNNCFYTLTLLGKEKILIYTMPLYDNTFNMYNLLGDTSIVVGNDEKNDIIYNCGVKNDLLKINYKEGQYTYEVLNPTTPTYINKKVATKGFLSSFDTIFILGLKIIIVNDKLLINMPIKDTVKVNNEKLVDVSDKLLVEDNASELRTFNNFYEDSDYYFKSPVFKTQVRKGELTIENPPSEQSKDKHSIFVTLVPSLVMGLSSIYTTFTSFIKYRKGETDAESFMSSLIMSGGLIFIGVMWPFIERRYNNFMINRANRKARKKYIKYLDIMKKELEKLNDEQKQILISNNLSYTDLAKVIENKSSDLFYRNIDGEDFLDINLGIGNVKLETKIIFNKPGYMDDQYKYTPMVEEIINKYQYVSDVPFMVSLKEKNVIAFILDNRELFREYIDGIILQLLTLHSYHDLKLVVLTNENSSMKYLKESINCSDEDDDIRYYATTLEEAQQISAKLVREFNIRKTKENNRDNIVNYTYYLIITDSVNKYRSLNIIQEIMNSKDNLNFGLLMCDLMINNIPNGCTNFVNISRTEGSLYKTKVSSEDNSKFMPTFVVDYNVDVDKYSRMISNIPIKHLDNISSLIPNSFDFLEMYGVGNVEQLNVVDRWNDSKPQNSLAVPIGIDGNNNLIYLDLHENFHGPHGLIAGMTGSGKSELIITYILSLALNFRPNEVQFVLIDYKGGGLAGSFENRKSKIKLPHLSGTITNLDKAEMKRTLVSINSELKRRQRIFNQVKETLNLGGIDIYRYQTLYRESKINEPLSHLFIICDEFAELKAQEPDFMDELVSAARIGRSLGIHLILATQKPAGVVDEQIWSNTKFRICCRVQTTEDSNETIKKPDAAYLKQAGSFYLQVGYDEYFVQGQSAYSGFPYIPKDRVSSQINNDIEFISNTGEIYRTISLDNEEENSEKQNNGEEFINILKYIVEESKKEGYAPTQLWLDNIPEKIYYISLLNKYGVKSKLYDINPVIGEYDDPKNQKQGIVTLPITRDGNVSIFGSTGSGKNTLLQTIIFSTITNHNCGEVNIYIIDLGTEKLKVFNKAPQVGEVLTAMDENKIKYLFYMLEGEKNKRQKYYSNINSDFLTEVKNGKTTFPNILVFIYDFDVFRDAFENLYDDMFASFVRNCPKYGIYFIVTCSAASSLGSLVEGSFPTKIALNMVDQSDYIMFFDKPPIPGKNAGRGIVMLDEPYEFQVSLVFEESENNKRLEYTLNQLNKFLKSRAPLVPTVPDEVSYDDMFKQLTDLSSVPLGVDIKTAQVGTFDFSRLVSLIISGAFKNARIFMMSFVKMLSNIKNTNIIILDAYKTADFSNIKNIKLYDSNFKQLLPVLNKNILDYQVKDNGNNIVILVLGFGKIQKELKDEESTLMIDDLVKNAKDKKDFKFIIFDSVSSIEAKKDSDIVGLVPDCTGVYIGKGYSDQDFFDTDDKYDDDFKDGKDYGAIIINGHAKCIKYMK